jgi:uncharacterized protein (TIGR02421 family)
MTWLSYKEKIKHLSNRIVEAQKPIRVLDAIKIDGAIETEFFANKCKKLPKIDKAFYERTPLSFNPKDKEAELAEIAKEIETTLGASDDLGQLLSKMVEEYRSVVAMLAARGTKDFYTHSRTLYGSTKDTFFDGTISIADQGRVLYDILASFQTKSLGQEYPKTVEASEVVAQLKARFANSFLKDKIEVKLSDGIVADAAAGSDVLKIREGAKFSRKEIDIYEVHEGYVHVATTLNGKAQKIATFLAKGPPRCAATQEGLAILMEILTFSTYPLRARTINDRILAIGKAEDGANFLEIYDFYLTEGHEPIEAFRNTVRVFRGGTVEGGAPFTKDISYCRGFIENYNFIRTAIRRGKPEIIPFLFAGKLHIDDVPMLYQKSLEGIVTPPALLPMQFADLNGLAVWMSFSNFLNTVDMAKVSAYYDSLFKKFL